MALLRSAVISAAVATIFAAGLSMKVQADATKVAFPADYAKGVMWLSVEKPDAKPQQVHELYAPRPAIEAASKGGSMPEGTVFTVVRYAAKLDANGQPVKGPDGHLMKGEILGFNAMQKGAGWGTDYPENIRNGEWEYRAFNADKSPNNNVKLTVCFECHKPLASQDFVQAYDKLKTAAK